MNEIAGEAGIAVNPRDIPAMAAVMTRFRTDADMRQQPISKGLDQARKFTWKHNAEVTLKAYEYVLTHD